MCEKVPILLLAYNRPTHFRSTIHSLSNCYKSNEFMLFINIDGSNIYKKDDADKHDEIVGIINEYKHAFKSCYINESRFHNGLANSVIKSVTTIIRKYHKIIVIEDDLVFSKDYLCFMDEALKYYEREQNIWSVTGFSLPLKSLCNYQNDIFCTFRGCSYGWGTWEDRWDTVDWMCSDYKLFFDDENKQLMFARGGYDMPEMLRRQMCGMIDSWAIRWCYEQSKQDKYTVYSKLPRVQNIGNDGSGTHGVFFKSMLPVCENAPYSFSCDLSNEVIKDAQEYYECTKDYWFNETWSTRSWQRNKAEIMLNIMVKWKEINLSGHNVAEYFANRGIEHVALYGYGKIGHFFANELAQNGCKVEFIIDRDKSIRSEYKLFSIEDELPGVECIVVTIAIGSEKIMGTLKSKCHCNVVSILDVLSDRDSLINLMPD